MDHIPISPFAIFHVAKGLSDMTVTIIGANVVLGILLELFTIMF